jgi:hypothetical protein
VAARSARHGGVGGGAPPSTGGSAGQLGGVAGLTGRWLDVRAAE